MPSPATLLTLASAVTSAAATYQGFNYGSTFTDGKPKTQSDFESDFTTAAGLEGTNGKFTSARLYTMVQGGSTDDVISAIPAAIKTKTSLLLGLWASGGQESFNNELSALKKTIDQYCDQLDGMIAGISVGSEDLYRNSPIGIKAGENPGVNPDTLVDYIGQVRKTIKGTCMSKVTLGHVDTWTVYVNDTNKPLIDAVDWVGMDAYAYFEDTKDNPIANGKSLFQDALSQTKAASGGKPVWITETGWPVSGKTVGKAVPSKENAKTFWDEVGCPLFGNTNVWWFTLQDGAPDTPNPSFGLIGSELTKKPLYDLSCDNIKVPTSSSSSSSASQTSSKSTPSGSDTTTGGTSQTETSQPTDTTTTETGPDTTSIVPTTSAGNGSGSGGNQTGITTTIQVQPTGGSGSPSTTGAGSQPGNTGSSPSTSTTSAPSSAGQKLNSLGAAAVAMIFAAALL